MGASSHDALVVTATGTSSGSLRLNNGPLVQFNTLLSLTFTGNSGGDALTIHNPSGTIFAPVGGVRFDGGDQGATLTLSGGGAMPFAEIDNAGPANWAGSIVFAGPAATAITFTGVAHITDTVTAGTYSVNATDVANAITLDDGAVKGDGQARITIDSFPVVEFADKTNLILNAGLTDADQGNTIFVNAREVPSGLITAILNGGAGNDVIRVFSSPAGVATTVNGGAGDDLIAVQSDLTVPLSIFGGPGNDTIYGGAGNSLIDGGTGNNTLRAQGGNATIDSNGTDLVYTGDGQVTVNGGAGSETVFGGAGNDVINGDQGFNLIHAGDGNTTVIGRPIGQHNLRRRRQRHPPGRRRRRHDLWRAGHRPALRRGGRRYPLCRQRQDLDLWRRRRRPDLRRPGGQSPGWWRRQQYDRRGNRPRNPPGGRRRQHLPGRPAHRLDDRRQLAPTSCWVAAAPAGTSQPARATTRSSGRRGAGPTISGQGTLQAWGQGGHNTITGGSGNDILDAGPGGHNVLTDSAGNNILIGRDSSDVLHGNSSSYVYPNSSVPDPIPAYSPVTGALPAGASAAESASTAVGRWTEFAGSASGAGLTGLSGVSVEPSIVAGPAGQYVAWADQRTGNFAIYVALHTAAGWQQLAGSAQGNGISGAAGYARRPSITLDAAGNPLVAWTQFTSGKSDIEVAHYDPTANGGHGGWVALGTSLGAGGISGDGAADSPVIESTTGGPVVAWLDSSSWRGQRLRQAVHRRRLGRAWQRRRKRQGCLGHDRRRP